MLPVFSVHTLEMTLKHRSHSLDFAALSKYFKDTEKETDEECQEFKNSHYPEMSVKSRATVYLVLF